MKRQSPQDSSSVSTGSSSFSSSASTINPKTPKLPLDNGGPFEPVELSILLNSIEERREDILFGSNKINKKEKNIRKRLNNAIYDMMMTRAGYGGGAFRSTTENPFINVVPIGDEVVDSFVALKSARPDNIENYEIEDEGKGKGSGGNRGLRVLLLVLFFIALSHIASFIFLFLSKDKYEHPYACNTKNCLELSDWLGSALDNSTDPCDDFYQFACGGWMSKNVAPNAKIYRSIAEAIPFNFVGNRGLGQILHRVHDYPLNQVLIFYQACIDQDTRNRVGYRPFVNLLFDLKLMDPVTGYPIDVSRMIGRIFKRLNKRILIDVYSTKENFVIVNLCVPEIEFLLSSPKDYYNSMYGAFKLLRESLNIEDEDEIQTIVYLVMKFEAEVVYLQSKETAHIFGFPNDMDKIIKKPKIFHSNYDTSKVGTFSFDALVTDLFQEKNITIFFNYIHSILKQDERMYMLYMEELLNRTPHYTLIRYFQWALIKNFVLDMTWELQEVLVYIFRWVGRTRDERCFRMTFARLHVLAASRYGRELQKPIELQNKIIDLTSKVWKTASDLSQSFPSGMLDSFKETFSTFAFLQPSIADYEPYLQTFYKGLKLDMQTHLENTLQIVRIKGQNDLKKLGNIPPFHKWPPGKYSVNEILISITQTSREAGRLLNIPFASLQMPYMGNDLPIFDFGGFGYWVASYYIMHYTLHDLLLTHAKDRELEEPENIIITQKQMEMELIPKLECIYKDYRRVQHYSEDPEYFVEPTVEASRVKNPAYVIAVQLLVETIQKYKNNTKVFPKHQVIPGLEKYSPEQLLFMTIARHQCRSYNKDRLKSLKDNGKTKPAHQINTAFRNSQFFTKTWNCPPNRFMNPKKKCEFFKQKIIN